MELNQLIFRFLFSLGGRWPLVDEVVIFSAVWLGYVLGLLLVGFFVWRFYRRDEVAGTAAASVVGAALAAWIFSAVVKFWYLAPRPFAFYAELSPLFRYGFLDSFPSGHTIVAFAAAVAVRQFYPRFGNFVLVLALMIGLSRVIAGVHWPLDVLAGLLFGAFLGWLIPHLGPARRQLS